MIYETVNVLVLQHKQRMTRSNAGAYTDPVREVNELFLRTFTVNVRSQPHMYVKDLITALCLTRTLGHHK